MWTLRVPDYGVGNFYYYTHIYIYIGISHFRAKGLVHPAIFRTPSAVRHEGWKSMKSAAGSFNFDCYDFCSTHTEAEQRESKNSLVFL